MSPTELLNAQGAAKILGVTRQRVYQLIDEQAFPNVQRLGWTWVIPKNDVDAYKKRTTQKQPAEE